MGSWRELLFESNEQLKQTGLPKKLVRHLVFSHHVGAGSRILDAGCESGGLSQYFDHLGLDVSGFDESPLVVAEAHDAAPQIDFYCGSTTDDFPCLEGAFDLVIGRSLSSFQQSLLSRSALRTTVNLLSCVRPGKSLVLLPKWSIASDEEGSLHGLSCFERQLNALGCECRIAKFGNGMTQGTLLKLFGGHASPGYATISVRLPREQVSRSDWLRLADKVSNEFDESCCEQNAGISGAYEEHRKAA